MNIYALSCTALLALTALALPSDAAPTPRQQSEAAGCPFPLTHAEYTILTVPAMSHRDSEDGEYDHTVVLRFHSDSDKVDIKVLAPGEKRDDWGPQDECGRYEIVSTSEGMDCDEETFRKAAVHVREAEEDDCNDLQLHIVSIGKKLKSGKHMVRLIASSYTYTLGARMFTYELAEKATLAPVRKKK